MDFTAIWEKISPYVNVSFIISVLTVVGIVLTKILKLMNKAKTASDELKTNANNMFVKAIPKEITISINSLVEKKLDNLLDKIMPVIVEANEKNSTMIRDIAFALCSLRTVSETAKEKLRLNLGETVTEEKITLSINPEFEELAKKVDDNDIYKYLR